MKACLLDCTMGSVPGTRPMQRYRQLTSFLNRIHPYRWPVRIGILIILIVGAFFPIWPESYGMIGIEMAPETTLPNSVRALWLAGKESTVSDSCLFIFALFFTAICLASVGCALSALGITIFEVVRAKANETQL